MTNYVPLPSHATLNERAIEINRLFKIALNANGKLHRARWQMGQELLAAQDLVPKGEWIKWCKANLPFGVRDAQKMMDLGAKPDPKEAHEKENQKRRNRRKIRSRSKDAPLVAHVEDSEQGEYPNEEPEEQESDTNVTYLPPKYDVGPILVQMNRMSRDDVTRIRDHANALLEGKRNVA